MGKVDSIGTIVGTKQYPHNGKSFRLIGKLNGIPTVYPALLVGEKVFNGRTVVNLVGSLIIFPTSMPVKQKALEMLKSADPAKREMGKKLLITINSRK